jgi:hypothetical protein
MQYAIDHNFGFVEVSAKTGNGVKDALNRLVTEIYKFQMLEFSSEDRSNIKRAANDSTYCASDLHKQSIILDPSLHSNSVA